MWRSRGGSATRCYLRLDRGRDGRSLSSINIATGAVDDLTGRWPTRLQFRNPEVSPNGRTVVLDAFTEGRSDLWLANLDGSNLRRLTDDAYVDRYPVWIGNEAVVFQSNRGGQLDLWRMSIASRRRTQLTSSQQEELATDATADGGTIAFEQASQSNTLWQHDLSSGAVRQLTGDALGDYWPSVSESGRRIVFQRTRPTPQEGFQFLDAQVFSATFTGSPVEPQPIAEGFGPRLSPDGQWVAYYQRLPGVRNMRVLIKSLATGEGRTLSDRGVLPAITATSMPVDLVGQTMAWGPNGTHLFYLAIGDAGYEVHRADVTSSSAPVVVVGGEAGATFKDIYVSAGGALAWIAVTKEELSVQVLEPPSASRSLPPIKRSPSTIHYLAGWTSDRAVLLQRTQQRGSVYEIQFSELSLDGKSRPVAVVTDAVVPTAHIDTARGRVLLTRDESGVHNVFAVALGDGAVTRLTNNQSPGVSFSGVQSLRSQAIVFAREERKRDIWLSQRKTVN